jgi:hypothetical protein
LLETLIFGVLFILYTAALPPGVAPYRDTGEMASAAATLSVAHPTSYPSYVLLGHLAQRVPLGNPAYRLALLSAAAAALACAALAWVARRRWGLWAGLGAAALLALNAAFWSVAQVQEMYALWVLAAVLLMGLALRLSRGFDPRLWRLFCFASGLALTNRLDLLLWAPGLLWLALSDGEEARAPAWASLAFLVTPALQIGLGANWPIVPLIVLTVWWRRRGGAGWLLESAGWAAAGLSAYLFLPVRSAGGPWLDWNHPSVLGNLLDSLLRTRYGGTLDLLSKNYATGELFGENLKLWGAHLWDCFSAAGLALAVFGAARAAGREPRRFLGQAACWWWAGPVFLFIANLPPNPHAAAIVEPHYLLSDAVLLFWAAEGLGALAELGGAPVAALACAALVAVPLARGRVRRFDRRDHFYSYDYARMVLAGAPRGAVVVAKKDVQLYDLWSHQLLFGWRPDVRVVAQGLAASPWYQADWRRRDPSLALCPLNDAAGWLRLAALNGGAVYATTDTELPAELTPRLRPRGMLLGIGDAAQASGAPWALDARRGDYRYDGQPDFFTSDLVDSRAQALARAGAAAAAAGDPAARAFLESGWAMHWALPEAPLYLGYLEYQAGRFERAYRYYALAAGILDGLLDLAARWHALPAVEQGLRRSAADALVQQGVVSEKLRRRDEAERLYAASLARLPTAQAHYDTAVLFWGRDWGRVERELSEALALDPGHADAARYLRALRQRRPR